MVLHYVRKVVLPKVGDEVWDSPQRPLMDPKDVPKALLKVRLCSIVSSNFARLPALAVTGSDYTSG